MNPRTLKRALEIFEAHGQDMDEYGVCAEHDQLWVVGPHPDKLPGDTRAELESLNWFWDRDNGSWSHFT